MQLSTEGLELIKRSEGFRSQVYRDVAGFLTIGYGHRLAEGETFACGITEGQAAAILANDAQQAERAVSRLVRVELTQGQFDALVDFCFNLGAGRIASSTLLRELNCGHSQAAAQQLLVWDRAAGQVNPGLKSRREAEFALWTRGTAEQQSAT
jgi:lysozyme